MDYTLYLRALVSLVFVIGLMLVLFWLMKRFDLMKFSRLGGTRRLGLTESFAIDSRRRLVLVRRDGVEHLLLLSSTGETVIERGIPSASGPAAFKEIE